MQTPRVLQLDREELLNSLTHGLGLALSSAGTAILVVLAVLFGDAWHVVSCSIYGSTLVFLYTISTLYHGARSTRLKRVLKLIDHIAIFLLIAGTYTPFTLVLMRSGWGWPLFGVVWGCALVGILFKLLATHRYHNLATLLYLAAGWAGVLFAEPFLEALPAGSLPWIISGGLFYTVGVVFYLWERLPYGHAIWHLFVLAGSACHYFAVLYYVLPL